MQERRSQLRHQVEKHWEQIVPNEFHKEQEEGDIFLLMKVQGVSTNHVVYADTWNKTMWYYVRPDNGPLEWLRNWAARPQTFVVFEYEGWGLDYWRAMDEVTQFVLRKASDEVLSEMRACVVP